MNQGGSTLKNGGMFKSNDMAKLAQTVAIVFGVLSTFALIGGGAYTIGIQLGELRAEIGEMRAEMRAEIGKVRTELRAETAKLNTRIDGIKDQTDELTKEVRSINEFLRRKPSGDLSATEQPLMEKCCHQAEAGIKDDSETLPDHLDPPAC